MRGRARRSGRVSLGGRARATRRDDHLRRAADDRSARFANALRELGVQEGDRVAIYMPMIPELPVAMLACARIGAPHSVVFGGFSPDALVDRINDCDARRHHRRRRLAPRRRRSRSRTVDEAMEECPSIEHVLVVRRTGSDVAMEDGRDVWWHERRRPARPPTYEPEAIDAERPALPAVHERDDGQAEGDHAHDRRLSHRRHRDAPADLRPQARRRRLLVRGRHRLGHRPQLHRLRAARQRRDRRDVRGDARLSRTRTAGGQIVERYKVDDPLHRADGDPHVHEVGRRSYPANARPLVAAAARDRRRADQSRGLDVVSRAHRRRPLPDRRHLVADRDRRRS